MDHFPSEFLSVEDFLENEAFRRWVRERRPADRLFWQQWLAQHPEQREMYEQAVVLYLAIQGKPGGVPKRKIQDNLLQLQRRESAPEEQRRGVRVQWIAWVAAASVLLGVLWWTGEVSTFSRSENKEREVASQQQADTWQTITNHSEVPKVVFLPEFSSVLLSPKSQIRFRRGADHPLREVYLQGEGFFEVSKNPSKPFLVYTSNLTTKVLGTSFQVRSFDDEPTAFVKVKTGQVAVYSNTSPQKESLLHVNEELTLDAKTENMEKREIKVATTNPADALSNQFKFEFSPVPQIFDQLESSYHISIRYDENLLKNCTFTGQLNDVPFLEKIRLICLTIESSYELVDDHVIIHSPGCN